MTTLVRGLGRREYKNLRENSPHNTTAHYVVNKIGGELNFTAEKR